MAAEVVGKIDVVEGAGHVLIIRASGETVTAKVGDEVLKGDSVVTSSGTSVFIRLQVAGVEGVVELNEALVAKFDDVLFDNVATIIPGSTQQSPVEVGEKPPAEIISQFNEVFPENGIVSADEASQSDKVVDDISGLDPPSAGSDSPVDTPSSLDNSNPLGNVDGERPEKTPGADSETDEDIGGGLVFGLDSSPFGGGSTSLDEDIFLPPRNDTISPPDVSPDLEVLAETGVGPEYDLVDDFVIATEDTTLRIDVLANDSFGGRTIAELREEAGISSPLDDSGGDPVDGGSTGDPISDPVDGGGVGDPMSDPVSGGGSAGDPLDTSVEPDPAPPAPDPVFSVTPDPAPAAPASAPSSDSDSGGGTSFVRRVINFFRRADSGDEGAVVEFPDGTLVTIVLLNNGVSQNGGQAVINSDGTFSYTPPENSNEADQFSYEVILPDDTRVPGTVFVTDVIAVNDAPENTIPQAQAVDEDVALIFSGVNGNQLGVSDVDSDTVTTTLGVNNGTLSVGAADGATVSNNDSGEVSISGSVAAVNAVLASVTYQPNNNFNGSDTLTVTSVDGDSTPLSDVSSVSITVNPVNDAPVYTSVFPSVVRDVNQGESLVVGDIIDIEDVDGNLSSATFSVSNGVLTLSSTGAANIEGNGSGQVTITGTQAEITAASNLVYQGNIGYSGSDALSISFLDSAGASGGSTLFAINVVDIF